MSTRTRTYYPKLNTPTLLYKYRPEHPVNLRMVHNLRGAHAPTTANNEPPLVAAIVRSSQNTHRRHVELHAMRVQDGASLAITPWKDGVKAWQTVWSPTWGKELFRHDRWLPSACNPRCLAPIRSTSKKTAPKHPSLGPHPLRCGRKTKWLTNFKVRFLEQGLTSKGRLYFHPCKEAKALPCVPPPPIARAFSPESKELSSISSIERVMKVWQGQRGTTTPKMVTT